MNPIDSFRQEMDRLMENFFQGFGLRPFDMRIAGFTPHVDVIDAGKTVTVSVELPGMDEKDIEVSLTGDALTIAGQRYLDVLFIHPRQFHGDRDRLAGVNDVDVRREAGNSHIERPQAETLEEVFHQPVHLLPKGVYGIHPFPPPG